MNSDRPNLELDANAQRDSLLAMPSHGKVLRVPSRKNPFIDFYPAIKGKGRFLYSFTGRGFKDEAEAELVRDRINARSLEIGIREAVNQFRSLKSKSDLVTDVIEDFLADAPTIGSHAHSGEPYSPRTLDHYRGLLRRAQPYFACMTMREFFAYNELIEFKKWFRKEKRPEGAPPCPGEYGRGLKTDNEMVNCFAPLRVVAKYYERKHPGFSVIWPPNPTKLTIAKRTRKARRSRTGKREPSLTLRNVVQAISSINEDRQAIFWLMFYTQCLD